MCHAAHVKELIQEHRGCEHKPSHKSELPACPHLALSARVSSVGLGVRRPVPMGVNPSVSLAVWGSNWSSEQFSRIFIRMKTAGSLSLNKRDTISRHGLSQCGSSAEARFFHQSCLNRSQAAALSYYTHLFHCTGTDLTGKQPELRNMCHMLCDECLTVARQRLLQERMLKRVKYDVTSGDIKVVMCSVGFGVQRNKYLR